MKKKAFKFFTAMTIVGMAATLASCGSDDGKSRTSKSTEGNSNSTTSKTTTASDVDSEVFYCNSSQGDYVFTRIGDKFTLSLLGETYTGNCLVNDVEIKLESKDLNNCTAKINEGQLVLTFEGNTYVFYKMESYTVTFNNGTSSDVATVLNGKHLSEPEAPSKDGNMFVGWYKDENFEFPFDFSAEIVTKDMTLYARYVPLETGATEYTISFVDGEKELYNSVSTVNGVVYNLPVPASKDNKPFLGWWVCDSNDPNRLSYQYNGEKLSSDTVLCAQWDDGGLYASVTDSGVKWNSLGSNKKYTVTIISPDGEAEDFTSQSSSFSYNFSMHKAGTYLVKISSDGKESVVYYANKKLASVSNCSVVEPGLFVFTPVENAVGYKLTVECGDSKHNHIDYNLGSNTYFDFSNCPMKKDGIKFVVTAYSDDYEESYSTTFVYNKVLDKVTNAKVSDDALVWDRVNDAVSYKVVVECNGEKKEYNVGNTNYFSLKEFTGKLKLSVYPVARGYNNGDAVTLEYNKTTLSSPTGLDVRNMTVTWNQVEGAKSYILKFGDVEYPTEAASFDITEDMLTDGVTAYTVSVMAVASDNTKSSLYSDEVTYNYLSIKNVKYKDGVLSWDPVLGATSFGVVLNDGEEISVKNESKFNLVFTNAGQNTIKLCFYNSKGNRSNWVELVINTYAVYFEACTGDELYNVPTGYYAFGDTVNLPAVVNSGYEFDGWYNMPNGPKNNGTKFSYGTAMPAYTVVLYANWKAQSYKAILDCGEGATLENQVEDVNYKEKFVLPVPVRSNQDLAFDGWYTDKGGNGVKITDSYGNSLSGWEYKNDMTLYANWVDILTFEEVIKNGNVVGYKALPAAGFKNATEVFVPALYNNKYVTELGNFAGYSKLVKMSIPNTISYIDTITGFSGCSSFEAINVYDVDGYTGEVFYVSYDGILYHYNTISVNAGLEVKFVPKAKSGHCDIKEGTVNIPLKVFYSTNITSVTIPYTVNSIEDSAFQYCSSLTNVEFLETPSDQEEVSLTIGARSFGSCRKLTSITLPKRVSSVSIGYNDSEYSNLSSFSYCSKLTEINVEEGCLNYSSVDGVLYTKNKDTLLLVPEGIQGEFTVKTGTVTIGENAFRGSYITKVIIPGSVVKISKQAFKNCYYLTDVLFDDENNTTLTIEKEAFYNCDLRKLVLPHNARKIAAYAFGANTYLKEVVVNCDDNEGSEKLEFETGITLSIPTYNSGYSNVEIVNIGKDTAEFDVGGAFGGSNDALKKINVDNQNKYYYSSFDGVLYNKDSTKIIFYPALANTSFTLPDSVKEIAAGCFRNRTSLVTFNIGKNIEKIGDSAFYNCKNLGNVNFIEDCDTSLVVGNSAFEKCTSLKAISLPKNTTTLGNKAFMECSSLTKVTLADELTTIGEDAFTKCTSLTSLTIPSSVIKLGANNGNKNTINCFDLCTNLVELVISKDNDLFVSMDGVIYTKENGNAKSLCFSLSSISGDVVIPKTVDYICEQAFYDRKKVTSVTFEDNKSAVYTENGTEKQGTLEVGKYVFYNATGLKKVLLPNLSVVEEEMFSNCTSLESFVVPNTVTNIKNKAFYYCNGNLNLTFEEGNDSQSLVIDDSSSSYYSPFAYCSIENLVLPKRLTSIGNYAFGYSFVKNVKVSGNVNKIGNYAFMDSKQLASIDFDKDCKLLTVGSYAFQNTIIQEIALPDTVEKIGASAFKGTKITSFTVPKNLTEIATSCFDGCKNLETLDFKESSISKIATKAFANCSMLTSLSVPKSVTSIADNAFNGCSNLASITFASDSQLKTIEDYAFGGTAITSFTFPTLENNEKMINLGFGLFDGCKSLNTITISASVTSVAGVFTGCSVIKNLYVDPANSDFTVEDGMPILYNKTKDAIRYVFDDSLAGEFVVPDTVKIISANSFDGQTNITKIFVPKSVVEVGDYAFANCKSLELVEFDSESQLTTLGNYLFSNSEMLKNVSLPTGLTSISDYMFYGCSSLESISALKSTKIGSNAFNNCVKLAHANFSKNLTEIDESAFFSCFSLESFKLYANITLGQKVFKGCSGLTNVEFEEGFESLPSYTFQNCSSLTSITLPQSLKSIGNYCFNGTKLTEVTIPCNVEELGWNIFDGLKTLVSAKVEAPIVELGDSLFESCTNLENVELAEGIEFIAYNCFYECKALKEIKLPESLVSIGSSAFQGSGLETITLPKNVKDVGVYYYGDTISSYSYTEVFADCLNLKEVVIESKVMKELGGYLFENTPALKSITLPNGIESIYSSCFKESGIEEINISSVTELGDSVFKNCENLKKVIFNESLTKIPNYLFSGCVSLVDVDFPTAVTELGDCSYQNTGITKVNLPNISNFGDEVFDGCKKLESFEATSSDIKEIPDGMFNGCEKLTNLKLSDSLVKIGANAFAGTGVTSFVLPKGLEVLGNGAFKNCKSLRGIDFTNNDSIKKVGDNAFEGCELLSEITLPDTLEEIGDNAFKDSGLNGTFYIGKNVTKIGNNPFMGCKDVTDINVDPLNKNYKTDAKKSLYTMDDELISCNSKLIGEYVVESNVKILGYAFSNCNFLTKITIAEGVEELYAYSLASIPNVVSITLPSTMKKVGDYALAYNSSLKELDVKANIEYGNYVLAGSGLEKVTISNALEKIPQRMFVNCKNLSSVEFVGEDKKLVDIGIGAFENCVNLKEFTFPNTLKTIESYAFKGAGFESLTVPKMVTEYGYNVFAKCPNLKSVTFEDGTTLIGNYMFEESPLLSDVKLPDSITMISAGAFENCSSLKTMKLPETLTTINYYAFKGSGLETLVLPRSVETIGSSAFSGCTKLRSLTFEGYVHSLSYALFENCTSLMKLVIPSDELVSIGSYMFTGWTEKQTVYFTTDQKSIYDLSKYVFDDSECKVVYNYKM